MTDLFELHKQTSRNPQYWGNLSGASLALALIEAARDHQGINLVITADTLSAQQLSEEIAFFQQGSESAIDVHHFPDWETLPYDQFSPHQDIISQRLKSLANLKKGGHCLILASINTLMHRLAPKHFVDGFGLQLTVGEQLDIPQFRRQLTDSGYTLVNKVMEHGECAIRGSIIDIYPMGCRLPYRIDLFDDEIESIRIFEPDNQRSTDTVEKIDMLPAREFPLDEDGITSFRKAWRSRFEGNPSRCPIYNDISEGIIPAGIEYYLPLFFQQTSSLFNYLGESAKLYQLEGCFEQGESFWNEIKIRYQQRAHDITRPILPPNEMFLPVDEIAAKIKPFSLVHCQRTAIKDKSYAINANTKIAPSLLINRKQNQPLAEVQQYLDDKQDKRVLFCAESAGRREVLLQLLDDIEIHPQIIAHWQDFLDSNAQIAITVGALAEGVEIDHAHISIITESQLFGEQFTQQRRSKNKHFDGDVIIKDLTELRMGAPVVHIEHGIGRYQGLKRIETGGQSNEFLLLSYAGSDKIYVPVTSLHLISRYTGGDPDHAPLHRLGSEQWKKEKKKAAEKISDVAVELLDIYAQREAKVGYQYQSPDQNYHAFCARFPFEETPDQLQSIEKILQDMQSTRPMDRLVCGDVGFGKTEVAMRAAFLAVQNNKQVCVLVPTTLLAGQHFENFCDRFADFPVNIELLSRFRSKKQSDTVVDKLKHGLVDIVIGTHKLFQKDIAFNDLGLLVIDEEHRFGVKQKEFIKAMRKDVDILSLTATPIPRTLNLSMSGIRDISLITTPPAKRLAIKTFCQEKNNPTIREAILREILRGGQVFFLHNNVETIQRIAQELTQLVPEAKVEIAHGQMRERQLEQIMSDFYHHRFNILVCTTIIETGIDIPTANTIIIDRADKFGLAQLHQLRGRVGRSHHQAYAYLMTPNKKAMTSDAIKRLDALLSLEDLGAGFTLATHDLEIRGAGELLGQEQSGNMHAIGFTLYMELLERAVKALKSGKTPELTKPLDQGPEIDLNLSTIIPEDYIGDVHTRLIMYKRIANAEDNEQLHQLQVEMIDRFGLLPDTVKHLFKITELKYRAESLGITKIIANDKGGHVDFSENTTIEPATIIRLIQVHPKRYQLGGASRLKFKLIDEKPNRFDTVYELIQRLTIN